MDKIQNQPRRGVHFRFDMERNCGPMKVLAGSLILLFVFFAGTAQAQQTRGGNVSPTLFGSVTQGTPTSGVIPLSISDAIDRALKYNLGMIVSEQESQVSRASRLRALSDLLPKVSAGVTETVQQTNLAAFGFGVFPAHPLLLVHLVFSMPALVTLTLCSISGCCM